MKRWLALLLCLLLAPLSAAQAATVAQTPPDQLVLDERGFLPRDGGQAEYLWEDAENGLWQYVTPSLFIRVRRMEDDSPLIWLETEVRASPESPLITCMTQGDRPGRKLQNPLKLAKANRLVLAITDDFSGARIQKKQTTGVVIRNGIILGEKTYRSERRRGWPNLDTLAVLSDGSLKANACDAFTAQEYLEMGATNVFAFGPILLHGGQLSAEVLDPDYYAYREPRMALGMIEPYHYIILTAEGREKDTRGARLRWLADRMAKLGVTEAINLDGGGTAALMFMGKVLNRSASNMRSVNSLIGFGQSDLALQ